MLGGVDTGIYEIRRRTRAIRRRNPQTFNRRQFRQQLPVSQRLLASAFGQRRIQPALHFARNIPLGLTVSKQINLTGHHAPLFWFGMAQLS
jgi:hypothetical protein